MAKYGSSIIYILICIRSVIAVSEIICPEPQDPVDGKVILVSDGKRKDDLISYTCNEGTILLGASFAKCMDNGKWSSDPPTCTKPCRIPNIRHGKMGTEKPVEKQDTPRFVQKEPGTLLIHGEKVLLRCNPNFEFPIEELTPGDIEIICDVGTLKPQPACHPAWCRGPLPDNGIGKPPLPPYNKENGSLVEYEDACLYVEKIVQKKTALCLSGTWEVTEAICQAPCKVKELENLYTDTSGKEYYESGDVIQVGCEQGNEQSSARNILCFNGKWKVTNISCKVEKSCDAPPEFQRSRPCEKGEDFPVDTGIKYCCDAGFKFSGNNNIAICLLDEDGQNTYWSVPDYQCYRNSCDAPSEFERSRPCEKGEDFPVNASVKYCCDAGFRFSGSNKFATCVQNEDGKTTHWNIPEYQCNPVSCSSPDEIENGHIIGTRYTFPNSVKYECNVGYKLRGVNKRYCETSGEWSGRVPRCQIVTCPNPEEIERGTVSFSSTKYSSIATYKCAAGFIIEGQKERICTERGVWEGVTPKCIEVVCPEPKDPVNGKVTLVTGGRHKDSRISYTCNEGTDLIGANFAKCMEDGTWSSDTPFCSLPCIIPRLYRGKMGTEEPGRRWNTWRFVEKVHGSTLIHGEKLLLRCHKNYELPVEDLTPGDVEIVCDMGTLKPKPACHPAWCRSPLPDNGIGIPPSPPYKKEDSSVVEYEYACSEIGKTLQKKRALCRFGTWEITEAVCQDSRCKTKDLESLHVDIRGKEVYESGELIEVQCDQGYEQTSARNIICFDGSWQITKQPCKPSPCRYDPPEIEGAEASILSGEHGSKVDYRCLPPYELVSIGSISCSYGQWLGALPSCKDTRCHTSKLFEYDGIKIENKTVNNKEYYTPSCKDGYDSTTVILQCNKGIWGSDERSPTFCEPGNCILPYVAYGEFYLLKIKKGYIWNSEKLEKADTNHIAKHNDELFFKCQGNLKFQGKIETKGNGIRITCNKKQLVPKPECWYFPPSTTITPATTDQPTENKLVINEMKIIIPEDILNNETEKSLNNHTESEIIPEENIQNYSNCEYQNSDRNLVFYFGNEITHVGVLPHGFSLRFGCQPLGMIRLHGPSSVTCIDGEWEPKNFPKCFVPSKAKDVVIMLHSDKGYYRLPGDIAVIPEHSKIYITCYVINGRSWPSFRFINIKKRISAKKIADERGLAYTVISIDDMTKNYSGIYNCSSGFDSHRISLFVNGSNGVTDSPDIPCPRLNFTSQLSIIYEPQSDTILPGTKAHFSCPDEWWELEGKKNITCLKTGKWSTSPPVCTRKCWPPPEIQNGYKEENKITVGGSIIYACFKGYRLIGTRKIICQENGLWTNRPPSCSEVRCSLPRQISNGEVHFTSLKFDSEIEYSCNSGYKLVGNNKSRCMDNGAWSNGPPTCEEQSSSCSAHDLSNTLPQGIFPDKITEEYMPSGSIVQLICDKGLVMVGKKQAICSSRGFWIIENTQCVSGCNAVKKLPNSSLIIEEIKDVYRFGDGITFSCPENQTLSMDLERIVCLGTGWSHDKLPTCIPSKE